MKKFFTILMSLMLLAFTQCKPTPEGGDGENEAGKVKVSCVIPINNGDRSDFTNLMSGKINWSDGRECIYLAIHGETPQIIELEGFSDGNPSKLEFTGETTEGLIVSGQKYDMWYLGHSQQLDTAYVNILDEGTRLEGSIATQSGRLNDLGYCHIAKTQVSATTKDGEVILDLNGALDTQMAIAFLDLENVTELYGDAIVGTDYALEYNEESGRYEFNVKEDSEAKIAVEGESGISYVVLLPNNNKETTLKCKKNDKTYAYTFRNYVKANKVYFRTATDGVTAEALKWTEIEEEPETPVEPEIPEEPEIPVEPEEPSVETISIGSGNGSINYSPTYVYTKYSMTQQIFVASEMNNLSGNITNVAFKCTSRNATRTFKVYMVNTDKTSFSDKSDWIAVTEGDLVYEGEVTFTAGEWTTITFQKPFAYKKDKNVLLCVNDVAGEDQSLIAKFASETKSENRLLYVSDYYNIYDATNLSSVTGTLSANVNQVQFTIVSGGSGNVVEQAPAAPTNLNAEALSDTQIQLTWDAVGGATYNVYNNDKLVVEGISATSYTVGNLTPGTYYCFTVTAVKGLESEKSSSGCAETKSGQQVVQLATVTTNNVTNIAATSATCGGNVTSDGGGVITARGICWSTSQNPTTSDSKTTDGSVLGTYTSYMSNLQRSTTYYVRAYVTNSAGTTYGEEKSFTTTGEESKSIVFAEGVTINSGWYDVNKLKNGGGDINMCWAASASNIIQWWQDRYVAAGNTLPAGAVTGPGTKVYDDGYSYNLALMELYRDLWWNEKGGGTDHGVIWYFEGRNVQIHAGDGTIAQPNSSTSGGYFSSVWNQILPKVYHEYQSDLFPNEFSDLISKEFNNYSIWGNGSGLQGEARLKKFSDLVVEFIDRGVVSLVISLNSNGGLLHATTLWGYEIDNATGMLTKVWITDSDDMHQSGSGDPTQQKLQEYSVSFDGSKVKLSGAPYGQCWAMSLLPVSGYGSGS